MKQILQSLQTGITELSEIPVPQLIKGNLLVETSHTLVSAGTERMLVEFGKAGWIEKARQQPDKVRMVLDKIKTDGIKPTIDTVFNKLQQPLPLGYCNVGKIIDYHTTVSGFKVGQRLISNGNHAEVVSVPVNLCAKVPDSVSDEEAAFTVLGAVALQGIRLAKPTLGETIVVMGLGLVGLITLQLLRANGCRVIGVDFDPKKLTLAKNFGAEVIELNSSQNPVEIATAYSRGRGVDAVIVTAATKSNEPMHQAALMCRKRGRIVLVGVAGLELSRDDFFKKELTFQVSASYGPGRYDKDYEQKGQDYPLGFVRWTVQRNFEAVLDMMEDGRLNVKPLISHRFDIEEAEKAYELVGGKEPSLGILLKYPGIEITKNSQTVVLSNSFDSLKKTSPAEKTPSVSFIGSGNYATAVLIPAFKDSGVHLQTAASNGGVSAIHAGRKFCFDETTTCSERIFSDNKTDAVVITTRHDSHASFVLQGLRAGKHVFVEKPLCLTMDELNEIESVYNHSIVSAPFRGDNDSKQNLHSLSENRSFNPLLMVGFNRRFSPQIQKMKHLLNEVRGPKSFVIMVNAGFLPSNHWTQDIETGGGRIIGEACHFVDLLRFLTSSSIIEWNRTIMDASTNDTVSINLKFDDGSIGTIHYYANGPKSYPKERIEVFAENRVLQLNNYRKLVGFGWPGFKNMNLWKQDKGNKACASAFVDAVKNGGTAPIKFEEILEVTRISIELAR